MNGSEGTPQDAGVQGTPDAPAPAGPALPGEIARHLIGTAPWARFMAVLGFIGMGFLALVGLAMLTFGFPVWGEHGAGGLRFLGVFYLAMAAIYLIPLLPLNRFAGAAGRLKTTRTYDTVVEALEQSRSFWKRVGILSLIGMAITILGLLGGIAVAIIASLAGRS